MCKFDLRLGKKEGKGKKKQKEKKIMFYLKTTVI